MTTTVKEQTIKDMELDLRLRYKALIGKIENIKGNPNCQFNLALDNAIRIGKIDFLLALAKVNKISLLTDEDRKRDEKAREKFIKDYSYWGYGIRGTKEMKTNAFNCSHKNGWNIMRNQINKLEVFSGAIIPDRRIGRCNTEKKWIKDVRVSCN